MTKIPKKIFFRADGNSKTGLGHIIRSLALVDMLKEEFECHFIIRGPGKSITEKILKFCDSIIPLSSNLKFDREANFIINDLINYDDILVLDGYQFNTAYQEVIKAAGCTLVCIDDIHAYPFVSDMLINHAGGVDRAQYTLPFHTICCFGMDYLLLRKPFLDAVKDSRDLSNIETAFVCMGGADPVNFTLDVLKNHLPAIQGLKKAIVVLGNSYLFKESIEEVIKDSEIKIKILQDINAREMVHAMQQSQIGICSASSICYEYLCVGGGLFITQTVDNQYDLFNFLIRGKLAFQLSELSAIPDFKPILKRQRKASDGRSPERFMKLFKRLGRKILLLPARPDELMLYHQWANDPATRAQSFNTGPIPIEDHKNWFKRKLADPNVFLFTAYHEQNAIGQIRFDLTGKEALISYSVSVDQRGKGFGFDIIKFGILEFLKLTPEVDIIYGYVKQKNIASAKTFKRLNFTELYPDSPSKHPDAFKYILNL